MRTKLLQISALSVLLGIGIVNCGSSSQPTGGSGAPNGGSGGNGPTNTGGSNAHPTGGAAATGNTGNTGTGVAGYATGGTNSIGAGGTGNTATGGTASSGRSGAGGAAMGGAAMGGAAMGGAAMGGAAMGGKGGTAGSGAGGTSGACIAGTTHTGGMQYCSNSVGNVSGGYSYQLWSNGTGSGCMTPFGGGDAAFKANWNNSSDFLARVGLGWNETQTFDQLGTVASDFAYTKTGSGGGFSFIGIYGWSNSPLIEFYIVEDWYGSTPPTGGGTPKGSFSVDLGMYNVYQHTQTNQPSIHGTATFEQFFSVRQTPRQCGHISITEHFKKWASLGMTLGKMEEARLLVEVGGGTGSIQFTTATVTAK